ncbi:DUF2779 domain-containing protein [Candidatus Woesearchaeota archaeon]|nr:DUF2779 domain-containing protein [Candidatus Woesearchaeota archaeon]
MKSISKSKYIAGLSCPKLLWLHFNAPEKIPPFDAEAQARFDTGHEVGALAKQLYADGVEVERNADSLKVTHDLVKKRKPLFEATFTHKNAYCKADLLVPHGKDEWVLIEVKSSTEVKDEHLEDVAFQYYCITGAGIKLHKVCIMVLNNEYIFDGKLDLKKLLVANDVTEDAVTKSDEVEGNIENMLEIIKGKCPKPKYGSECKEPKECLVCAPDLEGVELAELHYFGKKAWPLINQGITTFNNLPADVKLGPKQKIQIDATESGKPHIELKAIKNFLKAFKEPLICLDFETINPGVPLFIGTWPYQQIPFQFSAHIIEKGKVKHIEVLSNANGDPRKEFLEGLKQLPKVGTVLAFNASFEKRVLHDLAEAFPKEAKWIIQLSDRMDDLAIPFKEFWYYHPGQHGQYSIKAVLPAMTGKGYEGLGIAEGGAATRAFIALLKGTLNAKDAKKAREDLLKYCGRDTEGMVDILNKLNALI